MTRVLIADDHPDNRYLLRALLKAHAYEVLEAGDGAEAMTLAIEQQPAIIVSDLLMPVLDGFSLLRQWRDEPATRAIPFIVYTATYTEPRDQRLALALGADEFLLKPAEPDVLLAAIRDTLSRAAAGTLPSARGRTADDRQLLEEYNEVLVRKLQTKAAEAERANLELRREIAERAAIERRLRDSEERFRATFEQAAVGIAHVAPDGRFMWVNATLSAMTGYSREELLARTFFDITAPGDRDSGDAARTSLLEGRESAYTAEKQYARKDGSMFWVNIVTTLIRPADQQPRFVTVMVDITERKRLEEELRQSQKVEALGRLAGGIAHDFNNLLTVIGGYSDMLLESLPPGGDDRELARAVREASERAAALTRQLLSFSRRTVLQPQPVDINAAVGRTEQMLRRLIGEDIFIETRLAPSLGPAMIDPTQLDQVLINLAVNARDAMPNGGTLRLETSAAETPRPGPYVRLDVRDTGSGIPADVMARIFEPFFTTKKDGKGTGLGLSTVQGIVQRCGGWIDVDSGTSGTTFSIFLPVAEGAAPRTERPAGASDPRGHETLLLVDDDAAVRGLGVRVLERHGYRVLPASSAVEAMRIADTHEGSIDLVLTDIMMPDIDGLELARRLSARFPRMKVLFMSGYTADTVARDGLLAPDVKVIEKPYNPTGLVRTVREVLDDAPAAG